MDYNRGGLPCVQLRICVDDGDVFKFCFKLVAINRFYKYLYFMCQDQILSSKYV